jgi:four helix bundle protein
MAQHFKNLIVWQKAMDLVTNVYRVTEAFPKREVYSLTDQIRRAAVSIPSNIAEGQAHFSKAEFLHFLHHSNGSLAELETQILIAERLEYTQHGETEAFACRNCRSWQTAQRPDQFAQEVAIGTGH